MFFSVFQFDIIVFQFFLNVDKTECNYPCNYLIFPLAVSKKNCSLYYCGNKKLLFDVIVHCRRSYKSEHVHLIQLILFNDAIRTMSPRNNLFLERKKQQNSTTLLKYIPYLIPKPEPVIKASTLCMFFSKYIQI